jgi:hypothetical protein
VFGVVERLLLVVNGRVARVMRRLEEFAFKRIHLEQFGSFESVNAFINAFKLALFMFGNSLPSPVPGFILFTGILKNYFVVSEVIYKNKRVVADRTLIHLLPRVI